MILNLVMENIQLLKQELQKINLLIKDEVISIIIDGSIVRGDFIENSSDIDITITTLNENIDLHLKSNIEKVIINVQKKLPIRKYPRKPLIYDVQWQDINIIKECEHRKINEWNKNNIPNGYPKLWLYAFDSIQNHIVIYGKDITPFYTKIEPKQFVPIRIERIYQSAIKLKDGIDNYEQIYGGITQIKNAWEIVRCICIHKGLVSIKKDNVFQFSKIIFLNEDFEIIQKLYDFYLNEENNKLFENNFRKKLYNFTVNSIQKYYFS